MEKFEYLPINLIKKGPIIVYKYIIMSSKLNDLEI